MLLSSCLPPCLKELREFLINKQGKIHGGRLFGCFGGRNKSLTPSKTQVLNAVLSAIKSRNKKRGICGSGRPSPFGDYTAPFLNF